MTTAQAATRDPEVRSRYGRLAGIVGIVCNLLLGGGRALAGVIFSSISVLADGINNLSDATSSVVTLIGFKMSSRPADKEHPFGHARMEYVSGLVVAILILMVGFSLAQSSFGKILNPADTPFSWLSVIILSVSILIKGWLMLFNRKVGNLIESGALLATAADSRNDMIATAAVLASAIISRLANVQLDGWMGMAIALFILYSGVTLIKVDRVLREGRKQAVSFCYREFSRAAAERSLPPRFWTLCALAPEAVIAAVYLFLLRKRTLPPSILP